ncbi:MAG: alpha/beta hydrolase [Planctomycetota bacterium]
MGAEFSTVVTLRSRVRVPRAERGQPLVIALHGWGMTPRAFERWLRPGMEQPGVSWWIPRGILPCEVRSRKIGYSWYVFDGDQVALRASMDEARAYLVHLAEVARRRLAPRAITLLGFSQGGYLASYAALTRPDLFQRLICCCGRPKAEFVDDIEAARGVRVFVQTGAQDVSLKPELMARGVGPLKEAGLAVVERSYEGDHRMTKEMARDAATFAA